MEDGSLQEAPKKPRPIKPFVFLGFLLACVVVLNLPQVKSQFNVETINTHLATLSEVANRPYGPILFILTMMVLVVFQVPGLLMVAAAGLVYSLVEAFIYCMIAGLLGITVSFLAARFFLQDYFRPKLKKSMIGPYMKRLEKDGLVIVAFIRLFVFMSPPLNWLLGATKLKVRDFIIGSLIGMTPLMMANLLVVRKLKTIQSAKDLLQPEVIAIMLVFLALIVGMAVLRKRVLKANEENS